MPGPRIERASPSPLDVLSLLAQKPTRSCARKPLILLSPCSKDMKAQKELFLGIPEV